MSEMPVREPVEVWLSACTENTRNLYKCYFRQFEQFAGKSGAQMLAEYRRLYAKPETADTYPLKVFEFYKHLLSGQVRVRHMGSVKGRAGGWTGKFKDKPISQKTARAAVTAVQSFFSFHNLPVNLKKFIKKDARMKKPKVERKKHQLLANQVESLLQVANLRDKAIFCLGMCGQDESTVAGLRVEQFEEKLNGEKLEFVDLLRPKTNEEILLALTPEVQDILAAYVKSLGKKEGWLFLGYKKRHIQPSLCNDIFKDLCERAQVKGPNGKRLSYHCCRMWFSMQLRGRVSDDIIDLLTGHALRYQGAYMEDMEKIRELLTEADIVSALRLQNVRMPGKEEELRKKSLLDFARLQGYGETELKRLEEVLARAKDVDEAIREFRRFKEEPETMHNGNGKYLVVKGEEEMIRSLSDGWRLIQSLNHDKYLLKHS